MIAKRHSALRAAAVAVICLGIFAAAEDPPKPSTGGPLSNDRITGFNQGVELGGKKLPQDGYWTWRVEFAEKAEAELGDSLALSEDFQALRMAQDRSRREQIRALGMIAWQKHQQMEDAGWGNMMWGWVGLHRTSVHWNQETFNRYEVRLAQIAGELEATNKALRAKIEVRDHKFADLINSLKAQEKKSSQRPGEADRFAAAIGELEDRRIIERFDLLDQAGLHREYQQEMQKFFAANPGMTPEVKDILTARQMMAAAMEGEWELCRAAAVYADWESEAVIKQIMDDASVEAYSLLRPLADADRARPEEERHHTARLMLVELEQRLLGMVSRKLEQEKEMTLAGFQTYLSKRGFDGKAPELWPDLDWDVINGLFLCGPITLVGGAMDVPGAMVDEAGTELDEVAKYQVAIMAMTRLLRGGSSLAEILQMTSDELGKKLVVGQKNRVELSHEKKVRLGSDIHDACINLPDLNALARGDAAGFFKKLNRGYYARASMDQSWSEWCGDMFSLRHIALFWAPGGLITKVNGVWTVPKAMGGTGLLGPSAITAASEAGQALRLQTMVTKFIGGSSAWQRFSGMSGVRWFTQRVAADQLYLNTLQGGEFMKNMAARFAGSLIIFGGGPYALNNLGWKKTAFLVGMLAELNLGSIAYDVMAHSGMEMPKLRQAVKELQESFAKQKDRMDDFAKLINGMDDAIKQGRGGRRVQPPRFEGTMPVLPGDYKSSAATLDEALAGCEKAIKAGQLDEAAEAFQAASKLLKKEQALLVDQIRLLKKAEEEIQQALAAEHALPQEKFEPLQTQIDRHDDIARFLDADSGKFVDKPSYGPLLMEGDALMRDGDFGKALQKYREAMNHTTGTNFPVGASADLVKVKAVLQRRIALADRSFLSAKQLKTLQKQPRLSAGADIPAQTAKETCDKLSAMAGRNEATLTKLGPEHSTVFLIKAANGEMWVVKVPPPRSAINADLSSAECAAYAICRELGLPAPGARTVHIPDNLVPGAAGGEGILMHAIDGVPIASLSEPEILAHAADLARLRVIRAWLGDVDAHLDNVFRGKDGRLWALDMPAIMHENRIGLDPDLAIGHTIDLPANHDGIIPDDRDFLEVVFAVPEIGPWARAPQYQAVSRLDQLLPPEELLAAAHDIQKLCADREKLLGILRQHYPEAEAVRRADVLTSRSKALPEVLDKSFNKPVSPDAYNAGGRTGFTKFGPPVPPQGAKLPMVDPATIPESWLKMKLPPSEGKEVIVYRGFADNAEQCAMSAIRPDKDVAGSGVLSRRIDTAQDSVFNAYSRNPVLSGPNSGGVVEIRISPEAWDELVRMNNLSERDYYGFSRELDSTEIRVNTKEAAALINSQPRRILPPDSQFDRRKPDFDSLY